MAGPIDRSQHPEHRADREAAERLHRRFSGAPSASPHLPPMDGGEVAVPEPVLAVSGTDAAAVERWADGLRADLARLTAELREFRAEAEAAEHGLVTAGPVGEGGRPTEVLEHVDQMLASTRSRVEAMLRLAREESSGVVTGAMEEVANSLCSAVAATKGTPQGDMIAFDTRDDDRAVAPLPAPRDASLQQLRDRVRQLAQRTRT